MRLVLIVVNDHFLVLLLDASGTTGEQLLTVLRFWVCLSQHDESADNLYTCSLSPLLSFSRFGFSGFGLRAHLKAVLFNSWRDKSIVLEKIRILVDSFKTVKHGISSPRLADRKLVGSNVQILTEGKGNVLVEKNLFGCKPKFKMKLYYPD